MCLWQRLARPLRRWQTRRGRQAVVILVVASLGGGGCSLAGRSLGGYIDDRAITRSVKHSFAGQRDGRLSRVTVDTFDGTVYLTGTVDSEQTKSDAEAAAWHIGGVSQVVNDVRVRASVPAAGIATVTRSPLLERLHGIARVEPGLPGGPDEAYDRGGRLVASIYIVPMRELALTGFDEGHPPSRPIDHVSIFPVLPHGDVPDEEYYVVLWHVSRAEAAKLQ